MDYTEKAHRPIKYSIFVYVWLALVALTWLTVAVSGMHMGRLSLISPFIIASAKAFLVVAFFMHIKYEAGIFRLFIGVALATMFVVVWLVYSDIAFRS
ncbi:MAG: cytochrome C oxidase subunit IV family protein [Deltaproteobacteria bacterium]|nr:cytochrome C oxidase subunit IV family protein [Deltaproteobacteria bacterium]